MSRERSAGAPAERTQAAFGRSPLQAGSTRGSFRKGPVAALRTIAADFLSGKKTEDWS